MGNYCFCFETENQFELINTDKFENSFVHYTLEDSLEDFENALDNTNIIETMSQAFKENYAGVMFHIENILFLRYFKYENFIHFENKLRDKLKQLHINLKVNLGYSSFTLLHTNTPNHIDSKCIKYIKFEIKN